MKKGFIKTLETVAAGILLVSILIVALNAYLISKRPDEKIHISKLIEEDSFRNAILTNNITEANRICNFYYEKLNLNCTIYITGIRMEFFQDKSDYIYNIFISGNFTEYNPRVVRVALKRTRR
ncbi:MAG: hypothetical protein QXD62_03980 [Candidatus Woesearchaeota archaeon]